MNVYVLDREKGADRRRWSVWLGAEPPQPSWRGPARPGGSRTWVVKPESGSLLVCHQLVDDDKPVVAELLAEGVYVLRVSRSNGKGLLDDGSYERIRPVQTSDTAFNSCFRRFREDLEAIGRPDWSILEGPPAPDALLAYHLLDLLRGDEAADRSEEHTSELQSPLNLVCR